MWTLTQDVRGRFTIGEIHNVALDDDEMVSNIEGRTLGFKRVTSINSDVCSTFYRSPIHSDGLLVPAIRSTLSLFSPPFRCSLKAAGVEV
jgi:hypothetical protein